MLTAALESVKSSRGRLSEEWTCTFDSSVLLPESRRRTCQNAEQGLGFPSGLIASQHRDQVPPIMHGHTTSSLMRPAVAAVASYCSWAGPILAKPSPNSVYMFCTGVSLQRTEEYPNLDCNHSFVVRSTNVATLRIHLLGFDPYVPHQWLSRAR